MLNWTLLKLLSRILESEIKSHDIGQLFFDGSRPLGISIFCLFGKHFRFKACWVKSLIFLGLLCHIKQTTRSASQSENFFEVHLDLSVYLKYIKSHTGRKIFLKPNKRCFMLGS